MATRYLVIRSDAPLDKSLDFSSPMAWRSATRHTPAPELRIHIEDGHETDAGALRADPRNAAVLDADAIFKLVKPKTTTSIQSQALASSLQTVGGLKMPLGLVAVGAHTSRFTGQGVSVAVLDTGIDATHPAFAGKLIAKRDFSKEGATPDDVTDNDGHGTHCAGTICGAPVDGVRVGVAPDVSKLIVGKVLGSNGGTLEMFLDGMTWAVIDEKADVVSMSLGFDLPGNIARLVNRGVDPAIAGASAMQLQNDIIEGVTTLHAYLRARSKNVAFVAASGNESERPGFVLGAGLPAAKLFAVGAVGPTDTTGAKWSVAPFSNGRAQVVAPGVDVVSAAPGGGWARMSGTSMATPHVAGVAALIVQKLRETASLAVPDVVRGELQGCATRALIVGSDVDAIGLGMVRAPAN